MSRFFTPVVARRFAVLAIVSGCLLSLPAWTWAQGSLSRVRDAVRDKPDHDHDDDDDDDDDDDHDHDHRRRRRDGDHHHGHHGHGFAHHGYDCHYYDDYCVDDDCDDDDLETLTAKLVGYALTSPFWGPHLMVDQGLDVPGHFYSHPYDRGSDGLMMIGEYDRPANHLARLDIEYATDFENLERVGGRVIWEHTSRFGVDSSVNFFQEDLPAGGVDQLWLGDANIVYRFAQCENFAMRAGLGVNWLADDSHGDAGFNFTYGADWFPADPLVVSADIDWGTLGDAELFHGRASVGVVFDHVEVFTGYDYYDIDGVSLQGVIAGLRVWF